jgi:hypothetical protein
VVFVILDVDGSFGSFRKQDPSREGIQSVPQQPEPGFARMFAKIGGGVRHDA